MRLENEAGNKGYLFKAERERMLLGTVEDHLGRFGVVE